jgi:myo-inositol-1-phosphate synthase
MAKARVGIWLIGAKGGVATTTIVGLTALKKGLSGTVGLVSGLAQFRHLPLADWGDLVVGGHEIREVCLFDEAARLAAENRVFRPDLLAQVRGDLEAIDRRIRAGTIINVGRTIAALAGGQTPRGEAPREAVDRLQHDFSDFAQQNRLEHVVVVNVASTEPAADTAAVPETWAELERRLDESPLPASSLYAIAALDGGCSYINFTPSLGSSPPAINELAQLRGTRHMGCDGKTGETLLKSTLAPTFARRNLRVMSWVGHNIFGNMDGKVLADPANKQAKVLSKERLLREILGYQPQTHVSIEYIESLGDWKTAWDHVHFTGFLDVPMALQFTWQGCDSVLAAPLVLDLVRFTELARRRGQIGTLSFLGSFFKSPLGVAEHCFDRQFRMLEEWAEGRGKDECRRMNAEG